ncbi:D-alanine--D-alanine ligase [Elioraea sp. Yellowstone]|jgi:D-alanine-D-alanine ligase|uniref:D-alanine--D-alanine ligase family protein n=1 Tax=Elioraea sp. Yellowstone TaxID=2592070 RepID=UPI0011506C26|nr:D-alanine--D-alanine ligase [Elioraea sp. Yellowstone]TQF77791.1 D-alanine--D-alanine ligase [Elioraea sp. Yellowstone]
MPDGGIMRTLRVGFTYDLRETWRAEGFDEEETAEFDSLETVEAIAGHLAARGFTVDRIGHHRALVARLAAGERWDLVFNICEGLRGFGREALVPALCEAYGIPCVFSDSLVLALALHKGHAKRVVRDAGVPTAPFMVIEHARDLAVLDLDFPVFAKPVAEGTGKGVERASRCADRSALARISADLLARFRQPVLVETYLPGREFTVGIVGTGTEARAIAAMEVRLNERAHDGVYGLATKEDWHGRVDYVLATDATARAAEAVALAAWRALGCRDGGRVDLRCDADGRPQFLEVNPLAGLNPSHSDLPILTRLAGYDFAWLMDQILESALARSGLPQRMRAAA